MKVDIASALATMKSVSPILAAASIDERNAALLHLCDELSAQRAFILEANEKDMNIAKEEGIDAPLLKRLTFDEHKLDDSIAGLRSLATLYDPVGKRSMFRSLDEGLILSRIACPIGVIGVIFEARPDAMIQIAALCIKSGNCAVLKGGKEATYTNRVLFACVKAAATKAGLPEGCLYQAEARSEIAELLSHDKYVDLIIPRGSNAFVKYIMDNTRVPVLGHADGICHIYAHAAADIDMAIKVIVDAKSQYPAACNSMETLLVHESLLPTLLPPLKKALDEAGIRALGDASVTNIIDCEKATDEDFDTEFLCLTMAIKSVTSLDAAIDHINAHGSHHKVHFFARIDSAGVYHNCSTRFADGFRYGFGAEVGISTGKIHARGPVGLEGLVTYKYTLEGDGHIVGDYASGKSSFNFEDLD